MLEVETYQQSWRYEINVAIKITDRHGETECDEEVMQQNKCGE